MKFFSSFAASLVCLFMVRSVLAAPDGTISIDVAHPGAKISPQFYGLMTEEINHAYDGGLFAELIQNRSFQDDAKHPDHWSISAGSNAKAAIRMDGGDPVNGALPVSLRLDLGGGPAGVANEGYWGIPIRPDTKYAVSFYAKAGGGFSGPVTASLVLDEGDAVAAHAATQSITSDWQLYKLELTTGHDAPTTAKAKFTLSSSGNGCIWLSMVSLFPPTYQDAPGGLRPDLMKLLADLHPSFIRLPGGNYLEGDTFATRFDWKKQIGPASERPGHMGCWKYRSSDGFGLPQYLLWCKQLNADPILALFAGYTLNHDHVTPGDDLQRYVDEGLEEIEYVCGPADSTWGKRRAADGFTEPFKLTYVEVGNEDWFDGSGSYDGRFTQFYKAIKAKYPDLKLIATAPVHSVSPDLYDDHYYRSARQMAFDWDHYHQPKTPAGYEGGHTTGAALEHTKVFVGEWATQEGRPTPDLNAALGDAAWLMGLERDGDTVPIQCYAPLFVNVNPGAWQWPTNLIGYDALHSFGSPSYYALALFGQNKGDVVLPTTVSNIDPKPTREIAPHGGIGVGTWHTNAEFKDISVTSGAQTLLKADLTQNTDGWRFTGDKWSLQDNAIKPSAGDSETWAFTGDPKWTDYTLRLKARKTDGKEGFLILYHVADGEHFGWWNIGGWGNTATQYELADADAHQAFGPRVETHVKSGKWYDLRLEVQGRHIRGYIDDKLVSDALEPDVPKHNPLFASACYDTASHEVILKVVNIGEDPLTLNLKLSGAAVVNAKANAWVLSGQPRDQNTVDEPTNVAPKQEAIMDASESFQRVFAPHSLSLIRVGSAAK